MPHLPEKPVATLRQTWIDITRAFFDATSHEILKEDMTIIRDLPLASGVILIVYRESQTT